MKHGDIEVALDVDPEKGLADSRDLNSDLSELMLADGGVGTTATRHLLCRYSMDS